MIIIINEILTDILILFLLAACQPNPLGRSQPTMSQKPTGWPPLQRSLKRLTGLSPQQRSSQRQIWQPLLPPEADRAGLHSTNPTWSLPKPSHTDVCLSLWTVECCPAHVWVPESGLYTLFSHLLPSFIRRRKHDGACLPHNFGFAWIAGTSVCRKQRPWEGDLSPLTKRCEQRSSAQKLPITLYTFMLLHVCLLPCMFCFDSCIPLPICYCDILCYSCCCSGILLPCSSFFYYFFYCCICLCPTW